MARILFIWELGGGMGHVAPHLPLAKGLRKKGHEVAFVLRNLRFAETTLGQHDFSYFQAPVMLGAVEDPISTTYTFAQILHNVGYGNVELLTGLIRGWKQLFESYQPDLILYDYAPTALLASREIECKKIIIGSGFQLPPDVTPLLTLRSHPEPDMSVLMADEARILANINLVLSRLGNKPVDRITQIYDVDEKMLMTLRELDHHCATRPQGEASYWGIGRSGLGEKPVWPQAQGKRIFAYLKPFKTLPALLQYLQQSNASVLIYAPEISEAGKQQFESRSLQFSRTPLNLEQAASSCDIAITNATHATTATFLLAGKPLLLLPIYIEQVMVAQNVEQTGAGLAELLLQPREMITKLQALLDKPSYRLAAEAFAKRHADFDADMMEQRLIDHIDNLLITS